ncbi:MAG: hypothetical protein IID38_10765 [Planctomycetes bacterium]|nr:hypothetical protein [Planctomycetota bacterium]
MEKATRLKHQLDRLLAQDFSEMGHQARIRHQRRIEELRTLCTPTSDADANTTSNELSHTAHR